MIGLPLLAWLGAGMAVGAAFFLALQLTVRLYTTGRAWPWGIVIHLGRWATLLAVLIPAARAGALPLLVMGGGLFISRSVVMRRFHTRAAG